MLIWCTSGLGPRYRSCLACTPTRDVPAIAHPAPSLQFADDIAVHCHRKSVLATSACLSGAVTNVADWLKHRHLLLNDKKSQVLSIVPQRNAGQHVAVRCNQTELPLSPTARYLGVTLDAAVKWDPHVDAMAKKVVQKIGALWRSRRCLSLSSRIQYVRSVIMPDLLYGSNAFSSSLKVSQLDRLQVKKISCRTERRERYTVCRLTPRLSLCSNGCPCTEFGSATPRSGSSWCGAVFCFSLRETTNLGNRIRHDRGGCRRNCGGETGASPPT